MAKKNLIFCSEISRRRLQKRKLLDGDLRMNDENESDL